MEAIMKSWILLSIVSLMLYGCAGVKYVKSGATEADYEADKAECIQQMLMSPSGADLAAAESSGPYERTITTPTANASARQSVKQCLQSKGWTLESELK